MNYLAEINAFEQWLETNYLPSSAQLLWYKLMMLNNRAGWSEWVTVDNQRLMALIQLKREATFIDIRNKLIEAGLIEYRKGKKGFPNQYKILTFNLKVQTVVNTVVETEVKSEVQTEVETVDIYKLNKNKTSKKKILKRKKFIPPTLEEVKAYCQERNNKVDAQKFFDYYNVAGWKDKNGNSVSNWKQKLISVWEKDDKNETVDNTNLKNNYHTNDNQYSNLEGFYAN